MRPYALASLLALAPLTAHANGRPAGTSTITFRQGDDTQILAGMTFGALLSIDSGVTWHWICENAIGYAGVYDPDYSFTAPGRIVATTFGGLVASDDAGCTWNPSALGQKFSSTAELASGGAIHVGITNSCGSQCPDNDVKLYRSDDNAATFPVATDVGILNDWWQTLQVAKSDPDRIYVSSYRFVNNEPPDVGTRREHFLYRSDDKGVSFQSMSIVGITAGEDSSMEIAGISPTNPDIVFVRVTFENGVIGDGIYRSVDGGQSWTKIFQKQDSLNAFVVRANGDVVAAAPSLGGSVSTNCKTTTDACTFTELVGEPHLSCLSENIAGELWGCTQNFGGNQLPGDGFGIMKTTDLVTWTGVLRYQDIKAPLPCPAGTIQNDVCRVDVWCAMRSQLGLTSTEITCPEPEGQPSPDGQLMVNPKPKGCCDVGTDGVPGLLVGSGIVGLIMMRRRRPAR